MRLIKRIAHVGDYFEKNKFQEELRKTIDSLQDKGLEVEVQYQTKNEYTGYSALVIGRELNIFNYGILNPLSKAALRK